MFSAHAFLSDILTFGHIVFSFVSSYGVHMQVRSANSHNSAVATKRNPIIIAFDRQWRELFRAPLQSIDCMAYGVRDDYESGYRGIKINQAPSRTTHRVAYWSTPNV